MAPAPELHPLMDALLQQVGKDRQGRLGVPLAAMKRTVQAASTEQGAVLFELVRGATQLDGLLARKGASPAALQSLRQQLVAPLVSLLQAAARRDGKRPGASRAGDGWTVKPKSAR